ncbi:PREDICTED: VQ motif-containing protein 13-like [Camelina sativa]|uniref:VQ motif-containing protein 13-like n=1 Tax=Camelina sativa TaxID=90675 RepID=A0ABM0ZB43_CAMSA|nr:PREDICTED: VQ motif-containing protein 13-like [Camelina sativa]
MENSLRHRDDAEKKSPRSITTPTSTRRVKPSNKYQTTYIHTDVNSFKRVVQMLTGISKKPDPRSSSSVHSIPPIKAVTNKKHSSSFRLYERRNSTKHALKINTTHSGLPKILSPSILNFPSLALSPNTPLMPHPFRGCGSLSHSLSPSILDFPSLALSPNTPLMPNPFRGCGSLSHSPSDPKPSSDEEERAIKEKGFYLHPSPSTTPRDPEPRLLYLFPSPREP